MTLLFLALAGCPGPAADQPSVTILSPANGAVLFAGEAVVQVEVTDFALVPPEEESASLSLPMWWAPSIARAHDPSAEPEGFLRVYLDGVDKLDTIDLDFTLSDIPSGSHNLEVELFYPDGDPFFPAVTDEVLVTVP